MYMSVSVLGLAMRLRLLGKSKTGDISYPIHYEIKHLQISRLLISHLQWPGVETYYPKRFQRCNGLLNNKIRKRFLQRFVQFTFATLAHPLVWGLGGAIF